jgi:phenylalanine-4-hydroxylase
MLSCQVLHLLLLLLLQGTAELAPFDPFSAQPKMSYKDGYQKRYFVLDSFQVGHRVVKVFAE